MADEIVHDTAPEAPAPTEATPPASVPVPDDQIVAQEAKLVGDEAIADAAESPFATEVNDESVPRQVTQEREPDPDTVPVSETSVVVDRVITDTSDPLAVQVPDAGKGDAVTPIARAYADARHVEDVFREEAAEAESPDDNE